MLGTAQELVKLVSTDISRRSRWPWLSIDIVIERGWPGLIDRGAACSDVVVVRLNVRRFELERSDVLRENRT